MTFADLLRARLVAALILPCALAPVGCSKDDDASEDAPKKKKKKTSTTDAAKKEPPFLATDYKGFECSGVSCTGFCVTPESKPDEADETFPDCAKSIKVPELAGVDAKWVGTVAGFVRKGTKNVQPEHPGTCCYSFKTSTGGYYKGRPLRDGDEMLVAPPSTRADWGSALPAAVVAEIEALPAVARVALAEHHLHVAALEHGSIAAFAHAALDLLALGAPADLVAAAHEAALDEIRHAERCYGIASVASGCPAGPGPLPMAPPRAADPSRVLRETFLDGCVGETLGSLQLAAAASACTHPALARVLAQIAEDEARHAELAFRIVAFLLRAHPELVDELRALVQDVPIGAVPPAPHLPGVGLLDDAHQRQVLAAGMEQVVAPVTELLVA
ncbi:MAG: ferritin-like domain-containing protein [Myxococcales bacterium]|nr:ferritin-like domain-containing protein [Myxococcales bacterium]